MVNNLQDKIKAMFSGLTYEDQRHLYFWEGIRVPKSVSAKVEEHEYPFDPKWYKICAKKEGITEHELRHKWQTINQTACDLGTETHNFLERYTGIETPKTEQQRAGIQFLKDIMVEYEIVAREIRMYSRKYNYAGTADLLLRHKITGDLVLADYKTNKDIFKTYGMLKAPFGYLEAHPYNKYQLQLSYYQLMLEEINCHVSDRLLVYLKADGTYKTYSLVDFTKYLETYLKTENNEKYSWSV